MRQLYCNHPYVYASSGDFGAIIYSCLDLKTGELVWRDRSLTRVTGILVDDQLVGLQEDGQFVLATLSPDGLILRAQVKLFDSRAWTPPTLVGKFLYIRNRSDIMAFELP